jgi:hypothetical protein
MKQGGLIPCHCQKCKGCPRKKRTERLHRAARQQAEVIDFANWRKSRIRENARISRKQSTVVSSSESKPASQSSDNSESDLERPAKRQRAVPDDSDQVCTV